MKDTAPKAGFLALAPFWLHRQTSWWGLYATLPLCRTVTQQSPVQAAGKLGARAALEGGVWLAFCGSSRDWAASTRRNAFWQTSFLTGGSTQLSLVLKDFLQSRRWEKHHMWLGHSWLPPNLPSAYLQEWNLGLGNDHLSPFMSAIKCKRIREQTLGFHPRETSTGD